MLFKSFFEIGLNLYQLQKCLNMVKVEITIFYDYGVGISDNGTSIDENVKYIYLGLNL